MPKNVCADPRADNADRADYSDPRADAKANFESREKTHKNADADPRARNVARMLTLVSTLTYEKSIEVSILTYGKYRS